MDNMISKIELKLGDTTISLTLEQAKKLKEALGELFGKEMVKEVVRDHWWPWYWDWHYVYPYYGQQKTTVQPGQVYYTSNGTSASFNSGTLSLAIQ